MSTAPADAALRTREALPEAALAAASPGLLAQPSLWSSLQLPPLAALSPTVAPWSCYWALRLDPARDPADARALLDAALAGMARAGDRIGELACLAALIEGFYVDEGPLEPLDGYVAQLQARLPPDGGWPSLELEAHVMGCGIGIRLRDDGHPLLARWAERGAVLMRQVRPGLARLRLATFLAQHHFWRGEFSRTALIVDALPGLDLAGLPPADALVWLQTVANHARCAGEPQRGQEAIAAALRLTRQHGLAQHVYALHAHGAALALAAGDVDDAQSHLDAMRPVLDRRPQADQTHYWHFQSGLALARGDTLQALELARAALQNSGEIGGAPRSVMQQLGLGQVLLRAGEAHAALAPLQAAESAARANGSRLLSFSALLMRAVALRRCGHDGDPELRTAWAEGARRDFAVTAGWWLPEVVTEAADAALARDIEPAYVRRFVRRHALRGPASAPAHWPWTLVLRGFGPFEAWHDDAPLQRGGGKTAQRPLDLLRALLAHGGDGLPVATALQWLWPEADDAAGRKAFDVALLRLRRLLGDATLLRLEGGRLSLDEGRVWSDVGALAALMHELGPAAADPARADAAVWQRRAARLLDLMRGPFLAGDDSDWAVAARERYRRRFVLAVAQIAAPLEALDAAAAVSLFERALDIDPLAESLSRRLMQLHAARGERAEALRVWRACRAMLWVASSLEPAPETRALAASLGLGDGP